MGGEFCSEAHKQSYHEEYNKLALSRLMQAQSKPDAVKPPPPVMAAPALSSEAARAIQAPKTTSRDVESGWTTVHKPDLKRLRAPETPAESTEAPAKPGFIFKKPQIQVPGSLAIDPGGALNEAAWQFSSPELRQPQLDVQPVEYQTTAPPPRAEGLFKLTGVQAVRVSPSIQKVDDAAVRETGFAQIQRDLSLTVRLEAGFAPVGMLPSVISPVPLSEGEAELEPPRTFRFALEVEDVVSPAFISGGLELPSDVDLQTYAIGNVAPEEPTLPDPVPEPVIEVEEPKYAFAGLLPLTRRSIIPIDSQPARQPVPLLVANGSPALPVSSPLPLRPKVVEETTGRPPIEDVEIPSFLRETKPDVAEKSVWGNVHRYLKNIVSCLLVAGLGGGLYWHFRTNPVESALAAMTAEASGEADRVRPGRQIFVYPASMTMPDYRVEFEVPASPSAEWVFRVSDPRNCYGMRLEAAPESHKWSVRKYVLIQGEVVRGGDFALPAPDGEVYKLTLEVRGNVFSTYAQHGLVDRWVDQRFTRGGFGYYGDGSEPAPVKVTRIREI